MVTKSSPTAASGQILTEAARRMLPVLAGRVLAAVTDRAVEKIDGLADRLGERSSAVGGRTREDGSEDGGGPGRAGAAFAFLLEQARLFLAFVARLAAQALEMLRRATERLRERRAPEGIDEAPEPEEVLAPEDEYDDEYEDDDEDYDDEDYDDEREDELDDEYDDEDEDELDDEYDDEYEDEDDTEERATVGV